MFHFKWNNKHHVRYNVTCLPDVMSDKILDVRTEVLSDVMLVIISDVTSDVISYIKSDVMSDVISGVMSGVNSINQMSLKMSHRIVCPMSCLRQEKEWPA